MAKKKKTPPKRRKRSPGGLTGVALILLAALLALGAAALPRGQGAEASQSPVVINEIMSGNASVCAPVNGQYYDWVELYNRSDAPQDISGWQLADSMDIRRAFALPSRVLQPGECLMIYAVGKNSALTGDVYAPFGLSADGETLYLLDASWQTVDSVAFPPLKRGFTYARDAESGAWAVSEEFTPGLKNTHENYLTVAEAELVEGAVTINELMANNKSTRPDADGDYSDWIELKNLTGAPVRLAGWALSDDVRDRRKWVFPDVSIDAGGYLLVCASGKDRSAGELHANFALKGSGETVYLYDAAGTLVSRVAYENLSGDISLSRLADGNWSRGISPSPGHENTEAGARLARGTEYKKLTANAAGVYINEVAVTGTGSGDWAELYNASDAVRNLSGCGLSDNASKPLKWTFPDGTNIAPGEYLLVSLGGDMKAAYTADFALSNGETLCLSDPSGALVDRVALFDQYSGITYGRASGYDQYRYFTTQTPGGANSGTSFERRADPVEFSVPGGAVQAGPITVSLSAEEGMGIYYTTDGSEPTSASSRYTQPITLNETTVLRAVAWRQDCLPSVSNAASYLFGVSHTVRIVSITGPADELTGADGVLSTGSKKPEVKVHVEMYEPDGEQLLSADCGLNISGMYSRVQFDQKSFKLIARSEYGDNRLRGSLFSNRPYTEYKSVVLRAGGQDNMQTRMRDSILTSLCADMGLMYQETEVTVVYINGKYWGHYNLRERINVQSIAQFMDWDDPQNVDFLEGKNGSAKRGSNATWKKMMSAVKSHGLESDENIAALRRYMDIENYLDYVAIEMYTCNQDLNNIRMYRNGRQDGVWRWIVYDLDLGYQVDQNSVSRWLTAGGVGSITEQDNTLFIALMKNEKMRDYFLTRMGELLATTFSTENVTRKIEERVRILQPEMEQHCARWGWKTSRWEKYVRHMANYAKNRPMKLIGYFQTTLKLNDEQMEHYFGEAIRKAQAE